MRIKIFAFVFLVLFSACEKKQEEIIVREPFPVDVIVAQKEEIQGNIVSSVMLRGVQKATIYSQAAGDIVSDRSELGKSVRAGEILLTLENSVQAANLRQATGMLEEAALNFSAIEKLFEQNSVSKAEFVRSQNNLFAAQTAVATAQKAFNDTRITAPFNAIVTMKSDAVQRGNNISPGIALFTFVDISKLKADISFGEKEIGLIRSGSAATVRVPSVDVELSGVITAVSSGSNRQTGTFLAQAEFENPNLLVKDGMSGVVSLNTGETKFGIAVPSRALVNNRSLLLAKDGKAVNVPVTFTPLSAGRIMLTGGISESDTIIVSGITQITGGDTITVNLVEDFL